MQTPVDWRDRPWRSKYVLDETFLFNDWMIFGEYPDGTVGISDGTNDIFERVPRDIAEEIIGLRLAFSNGLLALMNRGTAFDDSFDFSSGLPKYKGRVLFQDLATTRDKLFAELPSKQWIPVETVRVKNNLTHAQIYDAYRHLYAEGYVDLRRINGDRLNELEICARG